MLRRAAGYSLAVYCNLVKREFVQELMSAGEVLNIDEDKMLVFTPGTRPVKASRIDPGAYNGKLGEVVPDRDEIRVSEAIYSMSAEGASETEYEKEGKKQRKKYAKLPKDKKVRQGEMTGGVAKVEPGPKKKSGWGKFE